MPKNMEILDKFFNPKGVAIIGASATEGKPGNVTLKNFIENKEKGILKAEIYPVNPKHKEILGLKCYKSVTDIPGSVDLAVVIVPAPFVPQVMEDCGKKGIKAAIIISAGFSEIGNVELENKVKEICERHGIRVIGPNGLGVFDAYTGVDTMFVPQYKEAEGKLMLATPRPDKGYITLISQSGAFGVAALDYMKGEGIGVSKFISYGNKMDVDEADLMEYLAKDPTTKAILIYVESIENGRRFMKAAKKVVKEKPIVVFKAGRTEAGSRAAASHTAALAGSDRVYDAAFKQCGVVRAETMEDFFDFGKALAMQPPAKGRNIAILTDGGGAGVTAADALEFLGLNVIQLSEETLEKFEQLKKNKILPPFAVYKNPIDLTGSADTRMYVESMKILMEDENVHGVVLIALHHPPLISFDLPEKIAEVIRNYDKPVVACDVGEAEMSKAFRKKFDSHNIPAYPSPERASRAMYALVKYGEYRCKVLEYE